MNGPAPKRSSLAPLDVAARDVARRVASRVMARDAVQGNYTLDLALESMLEMDLATGEREFTPYVLSVMERRGRPASAVVPWESQPFCHVNAKLFEVTGDPAYVAPFLSETQRYRREVTRSAEGAVAHRPKAPGRHLLIDMLQDYAARLARAARLGAGVDCAAECADQFAVYRALVRNPQNGLWCQGRGWLDDPAALSPGAWSRGHGWLMRGLVESLCALPAPSPASSRVCAIFEELAEVLIPLQDADGLWHQILDRPAAESYPDSTGTGLVGHALAKGAAHGWLRGSAVRQSAERAFAGVASCVTPEGVVTDACPGPGPLTSVAPYLDRRGLREDGESHGPGCVIFACAGAVMVARANLAGA